MTVSHTCLSLQSNTMNILFLGIFVTLFGTAYSSCLSGVEFNQETGRATSCKYGCCLSKCCNKPGCEDGIQTNPGTDMVTHCSKGCCGDTCCIDWNVINKAEKSGETPSSVYIGLSLCVGLVTTAFFCASFYYCYRRRQRQTVILMSHTPTSNTVPDCNPHHTGYDQSSDRPPQYDAGKQNGNDQSSDRPPPYDAGKQNGYDQSSDRPTADDAGKQNVYDQSSVCPLSDDAGKQSVV